MSRANDQGGDALNDALGRLQWSVARFDRTELAADESARFDGPALQFHYVGRGSSVIDTSWDSFTVMEGDFLVLPRGGDHSPRGGPDGTLLYSGSLLLEAPRGRSLADVMPGLLMTCAFVVRDPLFATLMHGIALERSADRIGSVSVVTRLANVVTAAAIRAWVESGCDRATCLIVGIEDPDVLRAITAMHQDPGSPWTVDSLARLALTSRSAFAERFRASVSDSPARYLTKIRMARAMQLLSEEGHSVTETAAALGYGSDAAFSRAFRRFAGEAPSSWRRSTSPPALAVGDRANR